MLYVTGPTDETISITKKAIYTKKKSGEECNAEETGNTISNNHMLILNGMKLNQKQFNSWFTSLNLSSITDNSNLSYLNNNSNNNNNNSNSNSNNIIFDNKLTYSNASNELLLKSPQFDSTIEQVLTRLLEQNKFWPHTEILLLMQTNLFPQRLFSPLIEKIMSFSHKLHTNTLSQLINNAHQMDSQCIAKLVSYLFQHATTQPAGVSKNSLRSAKPIVNTEESTNTPLLNHVADITKLLQLLKSETQQQKLVTFLRFCKIT